MTVEINEDGIIKELNFQASLSSGPGGQHVNKTNSKIILEWDLTQTSQFSEETINRLQKRLKSHLTKENILQLQCDKTRSQHQNKAIVIQRFLTLLKSGLKKRKKRKPPKPGKKFHKKRLEQKKYKAEKKKNRKNPLKD